MHGLVLGRFLPPHIGHLAMLRTAAALVEQLTIVICHAPGETPSGSVRTGWLAELVPQASVRCLDWPEPHPAFADPHALAAALARLLPDPAAMIFGSDPALQPLANAMAVPLMLIDPEHRALPIRSRDVRADPWAHWAALPAVVRPFYARTICLHGPESTGKSTLAPRIADHFGTLFVPEYGRTFCEQHGTDLGMDDLVAIGRGHAAMTQALLRACTRRLILDTDPLMTAVWADMLFGRRDRWFDDFAATADLYLLLDIDLPWIDDGTRLFGGAAERRRFFDLSRAELERRRLPYRIVRGPAEHRFAAALAAITDAGLG